MMGTLLGQAIVIGPHAYIVMCQRFGTDMLAIFCVDFVNHRRYWVVEAVVQQNLILAHRYVPQRYLTHVRT